MFRERSRRVMLVAWESKATKRPLALTEALLHGPLPCFSRELRLTMLVLPVIRW